MGLDLRKFGPAPGFFNISLVSIGFTFYNNTNIKRKEEKTLMNSIAIIKIQLTGIIGCIKKYTSEPTITTITKSLNAAMQENNYEIILFACKEIEKWYQKNLREILSNQYVFNHDVHKENVSLIKNIIQELEENEDFYKSELDSLRKPDREMLLTDIALENLLNKFHQIVIQLRDRYDDRDTLDVSDEYDVQDLLHSLLKIYCDDIRPEEWTPSYAGTASRQDFLLKDEKIVIETKKTRKGLNNKELANELIIDIARYTAHPDCKTLICFVYDPENRIKNPRGFEKDLSKSTDELTVLVYIRP